MEGVKLAKCSTASALPDIKKLAARGLLVQNEGRGRSTSYLPAEPESIPE